MKIEMKNALRSYFLRWDVRKYARTNKTNLGEAKIFSQTKLQTQRF